MLCRSEKPGSQGGICPPLLPVLRLPSGPLAFLSRYTAGVYTALTSADSTAAPSSPPGEIQARSLFLSWRAEDSAVQ